MRQFVVSEAPASRVGQHAREVVEEAGGIVAHHTTHETEFDHLDYGDQAWRRAGYVGTYERFKEKPVEVRIRVWAQWPRRLLFGSIYVGFAIALVFFALSILEAAIPPNVWLFTAGPILAVLAAALLMYTSSMAESQGAEQQIEALLVERVREDEQIPGEVYEVDDWEAYRETVVDEAREEARQRTPYGGSSFKRAAAGVKDSVTSLGTSDEEPEEAPPTREGPDEDDEAEEGPGLLAKVKTTLGLEAEETEASEPPAPEDSGEAVQAEADDEADAAGDEDAQARPRGGHG